MQFIYPVICTLAGLPDGKCSLICFGLLQVELSANMKLLDAKNNELQSFIQRLNGNCSIIQVKNFDILLTLHFL